VVNEPVKEDEFSLVKLGLRQGDQVQDHRTGNHCSRRTVPARWGKT
jgi:hypothetical protein